MKLNFAFLEVPANGETYVRDDEVTDDFAKQLVVVAAMVHNVLPKSGGANNLSEYEEGYGWDCYVDDMIALKMDLDAAGIEAVWPGNVRPTYSDDDEDEVDE